MLNSLMPNGKTVREYLENMSQEQRNSTICNLVNARNKLEKTIDEQIELMERRKINAKFTNAQRENCQGISGKYAFGRVLHQDEESR